MGRNPFAHFRHPFVQQFRQHDLAGEQLGPVLVSDAQGVAKALGDQQQGRSPLRSSRALVATVVPIFTTAMDLAGIG